MLKKSYGVELQFEKALLVKKEVSKSYHTDRSDPSTFFCFFFLQERSCKIFPENFALFIYFPVSAKWDQMDMQRVHQEDDSSSTK